MFTETRPLNPTRRSAKSANENKPFNLTATRSDPGYGVLQTAQIETEPIALGGLDACLGSRDHLEKKATAACSESFIRLCIYIYKKRSFLCASTV